MAGGLLGFVGMSALAGVLVTASVTPAIAVTGIAATSSISMFENLPGYLEIDKLAEKSDIYATKPDGSKQLLASFFVENREEVAWDDISQFVKDAAIAGEDPRFYEHGGIDIQGTIRGAVNTVLKGNTQGGSSITQQYVKNVLINNGVSKANTQEEVEAAYDAATEVSADRKLKEMRYAIALEKKYSKDEILQGYLNIAAFGGRVYGIESAAQYYFGVSAKDVSIAQAASLIAIVNHPQKFRLDQPDDPANGAESVDEKTGELVPYAANKQRRDYVIREMLKEKTITQEQADEALATAVEPNISEPSTGCTTAGGAAFFCDYVTWVIRNNYDDPATEDVDEGLRMLQRGGLQIDTTLDLELQTRADQAMAENVPSSDPRFDVGSVAVSVQPGTGKVLAMSVNKHYTNSDEQAQDPNFTGVNYATDYAYGGSGGFQPGSTFKVFTLAEWLNEGHSLTETFNGSRRAFTSFPDSCNGTWRGDPWNPLNDDSNVANNAVDATKYSVNSAFAAMAQMTDLCKIKQTAEAFGVKRADGNPLGTPKSNPDQVFGPSDIIGTQEVSPLSMAAAFAGIANDGVTCSPIAIEKIVDSKGEEIAPPKSECNQSVTPDVAHAMQYAMQTTFSATASESNTGTGIAHIGKTGTTDHAKDTWMVGASTAVATAVWVGAVTGDVNQRELSSFDSGPVQTARHRMWKSIMTLADEKYGGNAFSDPGNWAFKQVMVAVPDVKGLSLEEAKKAIESAGFVFEDGGQQDSDLPRGQATGTDPSGEAGRGTTIRVFTSNGQGASVPNVVGMTGSEAKSALEAANLRVKIDGPSNGTVVSQSPDAGSAVKRGDRVTIKTEAAQQQPGQPGDGDDDSGGGGTGGEQPGEAPDGTTDTGD
ncbi:transglycosylase domain-containing protein [Agromyces archimandritae]|uniref:Transglycosylase domain-containing protein n=2 Tax=Agromyces archimandritae TaxID=2781962 RepID=A0A975IRJ2_9MICO|nr:transglycosylase domain-containing protein [Agromyces archimandritae]